MPIGLIEKNLVKEQYLTGMVEAMHKEDAEAYKSNMTKLFDCIKEEVLDEARGIVDEQDRSILASRGVRQLTSKERKYYEKLSAAMKAGQPEAIKQALTDPELVMPETVVNSVFDDLATNHPLLNHIRFTNTGGAVKFLISENERQKAVWGKLCAEITEEIASTFKEIDLTLCKLSAFMPVCEAMLDLGPEWLDRYVRECLYEALANGLEDGIINNLNSTTGPVGMIANTTSGSGGIGAATFTAKTATVINDLTPVTVGAELAKVAVDSKGKARNVSDIILVVNSIDYYTKVYPATTVMTGDGRYVRDVLPYPMTVIPSAAVTSNRAVFGMGKKYFMGLGMNSKSGRIEFSDEFHWLDDERVYKIKLYGYGFPMDNNAFQYWDITNLKPLAIRVTVDGQVVTTVDGTVTTQTAAAEALSVNAAEPTAKASAKTK